MNSTEFRGASVFVSGGAGFVGSHITDQVLAAGAERIVIIDDFVRGRWENLTAARATGRVQVVEGDICDAPLVDRLMQGVDFVFHQAALRITQCADDPVRAIQVMVGGTQNILEAAVHHKIKKLVAASSASVYGEASYLPMDEAHPFQNRTVYGAAKIANEQLLRAYAEMYGLQYVALRPFNIYGPRMDVFGVYTEVMIRWLECLARAEVPVIFGDGSQTMDFVYVKDVARCNLLAMSSAVNDRAFNVGSGLETSLLELCNLVCQEAGHPEMEPVFAPIRSVNPVTRRLAAVDAARDALGFEAHVTLRDGLRELVSWHAGLRAPVGQAAGARV